MCDVIVQSNSVHIQVTFSDDERIFFFLLPSFLPLPFCPAHRKAPEGSLHEVFSFKFGPFFIFC